MIPASEFFQGFFSTSLGFTEMVTEIRFQRPAPAAALIEFAQRRGDFALVAAAASIEPGERGCGAAAVVLGGVEALPRRIEVAERVLLGSEPNSSVLTEAAEAAAEDVTPISDIQASADYRRRLVKVLVERAHEQAVLSYAR